MWRTLTESDREIVRVLCDGYGSHLYDYCRTELSQGDAELAVAGTLLSAQLHTHRLADSALLRPWLYALARAHRAAAAGPTSIGSWSRSGRMPDLLPEALRALDWQQRELLDLSIRHGLTHHEIGVVFDVGPREVRAIVAGAAAGLEEWFAAIIAARTSNGCTLLAALVSEWATAPSRRSRTRISRHIPTCATCRAAPRTVVAATLLRELPLAHAPGTLRDRLTWAQPLPGSGELWRVDGFPVQVRGLVEAAALLISPVADPTAATRGSNWPAAGAAAAGQERRVRNGHRAPTSSMTSARPSGSPPPPPGHSPAAVVPEPRTPAAAFTLSTSAAAPPVAVPEPDLVLPLAVGETGTGVRVASGGDMVTDSTVPVLRPPSLPAPRLGDTAPRGMFLSAPTFADVAPEAPEAPAPLGPPPFGSVPSRDPLLSGRTVAPDVPEAGPQATTEGTPSQAPETEPRTTTGGTPSHASGAGGSASDGRRDVSVPRQGGRRDVLVASASGGRDFFVTSAGITRSVTVPDGVDETSGRRGPHGDVLVAGRPDGQAATDAGRGDALTGAGQAAATPEAGDDTTGPLVEDVRAAIAGATDARTPMTGPRNTRAGLAAIVTARTGLAEPAGTRGGGSGTAGSRAGMAGDVKTLTGVTGLAAGTGVRGLAGGIGARGGRAGLAADLGVRVDVDEVRVVSSGDAPAAGAAHGGSGDEFWRDRPDDFDDDGRFTVRSVARVGLLVGAGMLVASLAWSGINSRHDTEPAPDATPHADVTAPPAGPAVNGAGSAPDRTLAPTVVPPASPSLAVAVIPTTDPGDQAAKGQADDTAAEGRTADQGTQGRADDQAAQTDGTTDGQGTQGRVASDSGGELRMEPTAAARPKPLPAPRPPSVSLSPSSVNLGARRTGSFALHCPDATCRIVSAAGSRTIRVSGTSFTVRAPASRAGCPGPRERESGVITVRWSGTSTGDGTRTRGVSRADGTLRLRVSWTVAMVKGTYVDEGNGGHWSNCFY